MHGKADSRGLLTYMWVVTAAATPVTALIVANVPRSGADLVGRQGLVVLLFGLVLVVGEMYPIPVTRGEAAGDDITVSSTFGFALLLSAPVAFVVLAQAIALAIDWKVRGRQWHRLPFNVAQYALAFTATRFVYALVAGQPFTPGAELLSPSLGAAVVAAATFLLINNTLVGVAVALSIGARIRRVLVDDLTWQITTSAPLLGLGPMAAQAMTWTPWSIVLLLIPIAALHRSGTVAMRREQEALRDALTGLANRTMLTNATERALVAGSPAVAMLLIDLDHFKDINDTLGHAVGDEMLVAVAERLLSEVAPSDLVARLGGDEFAILVRSAAQVTAVTGLAERLCSAIREPFLLHGVTLTVGCSVGIGLGPEHATTVADLLRCADIALYSAKDTRGTAAVYDRNADSHSVARLGLQADLRAALQVDDGQLWLAYQPQLDLATGSVRSVECLARWRHPELGEIGPDTFIPIAESTSLIDQLMQRVLDKALEQLAQWTAEGLPLRACVNLSARQLSDLSLPERVSGLLARHGVPPQRLLMEVTESRLMSDPERSADILSRLQGMGIEISVDDFGTGYSSLAYLQRLAVDELKIDKSFIIGMSESGNATIVRSTVELGHNLGLRVVAEGVEDAATAMSLRAMGCDVLQGYHVGRPVPASALPGLLAQGNPLASLPVPAGRPVLELVPSQLEPATTTPQAMLPRTNRDR